MNLTQLTERELEVMALVAEGQRNREIARALGIEESTVESHLNHIYDKLGVHSRTKAMRLALSQRIIELKTLTFIEWAS